MKITISPVLLKKIANLLAASPEETSNLQLHELSHEPLLMDSKSYLLTLLPTESVSQSQTPPSTHVPPEPVSLVQLGGLQASDFVPLSVR